MPVLWLKVWFEFCIYNVGYTCKLCSVFRQGQCMVVITCIWICNVDNYYVIYRLCYNNLRMHAVEESSSSHIGIY